MAAVPGQSRRFRWPNARHRLADEFQQEYQFHIDTRVEELVRQGLSDAEAKQQAQAEFGPMTTFAESSDKVGLGMEIKHLVADLARDITFGWRTMWRTPLVSMLAALALAVGIGLNGVALTLFYGAAVKALPYPDSERLVAYWPAHNFSEELVDNLSDSAEAVRAAAYAPDVVRWFNGERFRPLRATRVSNDYFGVLGVEASLGRSLAEMPTQLGSPRTVAISHDLWLDLGGAPDIVGQNLTLDDHEYEIWAVLAADHTSLVPGTRLWIPIVRTHDEHHYQDMMYLSSIARLAPDKTPEDARSELQVLLTRLEQERPGRFGAQAVKTASVTQLQGHLAGGSAWTVSMLLTAAALLLLVAATNVANLYVSQVSGRRKEFAVRAALGSGRGRLIRQLATEGLMLGALGAAGGMGLGYVLLQGLSVTQWFPARWLFGSLAPSFEPTLLLVTVGISALVAGLAVGLACAYSVLRIDPSKLRLGGGNQATRPGLSDVLLALQVGVAALVALTAMALVHSYRNLDALDPGFDPTNLLALAIEPPGPAHGDGHSAQPLIDTYSEILQTLENTPGIASAGMVTYLPLTPGGLGSPYRVAGEAVLEGSPADLTSVRNVSENYFKAMNIRVLAGRSTLATDQRGGLRVGLVNDVLAQALLRKLPDASSVLNLEMRYGNGSPWFTIVGVVESVHQTDKRRAPMPEVYLPYRQTLWQNDAYIVAKLQPPHGVSPETVRATLEQIDPRILVRSQGTGEAFVSISQAGSQALATAFILFAGLTLLLALIGVYAMTHSMTRRRRFEFGVRLAVGATPQSLCKLALVRSVKPCLFGLLAALLLVSVWLGSLLEPALFETDATSWELNLTILLGFVLTTSVAAFLPARRAVQSAPLNSLRD